MTKKLILVIGVLFSITIQSQTLKLEEIMKGNTFIGVPPENERWSLDGQKVYFEWNPNNELGTSTYFWKNGLSKPELASPNDVAFSKLDFKKTSNPDLHYYIDKGSLFSYALKSKTSKKLYQQSSPITNLQMGAVPGILYFRQNENLFQFNTNEGSVIQITNFRKGKAEDKPADKESFLKSQQEELFQFIRDQEALKKWNLAKSKTIKSDFPKPYFYGKNNFGSLKVDPKGNFATFRLIEDSERKNEKMEVFITADGYNQIEDTKAKVSTDNLLASKFGVYDIAKDSVYFVNFSSLSHIQDVPKYFELYEKSKTTEKKDKLIVVQEPIYNENGSYAIAEIRSQDNKDRWIVSLNLKKGTFQELDHQHDEAWIGGPGIPSYSFGRGTLGFLGDNETVYFQSEETGYSHLYTYNLKSKKKTQLTKGNWEVRNVNLSKDKKSFYLTTTTTHPGNRDFYKLEVANAVLQPILTKDGAHEVSLSPDESTLIVRYSYKNKPWELYVAPNKKNTNLIQRRIQVINATFS